MRSTFSILFYINRGKIKADGTTAVMCRITIDGRNTAITTGICCKPEDWNARTGTIRTVRENARLQEYRKYIEQTYEEILRTQGVVSAEIIKNRVTRQFVVPTHLLRMGEIERERLRIRSREINSTSTYRQSQYFQKYLTDYLASLGKKDIAFEEITEDFGRNYKAFLIRNKNFSTSQTNRCLCWLNRLLYLAVDNEILRTNPVENVEYEKKTAPKHKYVTREEMKRILAMPLNEGRAELGRRAFIFSYFTGLAYADIKQLHPYHIGTTAEGRRFVRINRKKTGVEAFIPLHPIAEQIPSRGHITKGAALSLLGRVALYNEKWDDAIAAYKQVQGLGYSLDPSYAKLFTQSGETSPEIIFAVRYEGPGMSEGAAFNAHWNTPLEAMNGTIDLADAYYCKDGKPTTDTKIAELNGGGGLDVSKPNPAHFENRDPRLYSTLFVPGMLWNGKGGIDTSASNPYANVYGGAAASLSTVYVYKYFDPTDTSNSWDNGQDFYVVRYAEVLLSLAEAMVQKGGYVYSDVTALVNEVRQRADVNMPTVEEVEGTSLSKDELLEVIKHERRVELAFEGLRLFDLYRWKELDKAVANIENERTMYGLAYEARKFNGERDYVWPLPTAELDTNKKLVQHDLWK